MKYEETRAVDGYKMCSKCRITKKVSEFHKNKGMRDGYGAWCIACLRNYKQQHIHIYWSRATMERHTRKGFEIQVDENTIVEMAKKSKECPICGVELSWVLTGRSAGNSPSLDRKYNETILTKDNIWIICRRCNTTKSDRTMDEFIEYCKFVSERFE